MLEEGKNKGPEWESVVSNEIIVKELSNSTYGIMGLDYGRYYSVDIAESITLFGHWCINFAKDFYIKEGYDVIYGDTDSVFVSTKGKILDVKKSLDKFHKSLKKTLKEKYNIDECFIELEFDKEYDGLILIAKKAYVGRAVNIEGKKVNQIYARGLEFIKRDTFSFAAKKQEELINLILEKKDKDFIYKWFVKTKNLFYRKKLSKTDLILTQRIGKPLKEYKAKTLPLHVRIAKEMNKKTGEDFTNSEIEYIVTGTSPVLQGIRSDEYNGEFDRDYYWYKKTFPLLERIVKNVHTDLDLTEFKPMKKTKKKEKNK
jgi:DNA polymerase elongation subunit (family B)